MSHAFYSWTVKRIVKTHLLLASLALSGPARAQSFDFREVTRLAEGALVGEHVNDPVPGFKLLIRRNGQTIYQHSFGEWSPGQVAKIDSASKTITGAVLMSLTEWGPTPVSLDAKLSDYLSAFATDDKRSITLRQAFSHTGGMEPGVTFWALFSGGLTLRQASTAIALKPLLYEPGTAFAYGSISMHAAGAAAEAAAGIPFVELLTERITGPMEMAQTTFYTASEENPRIDAGLESTAAEFSRFMDMLLLEGVDRDSGQRILSVASVREMLTRQTTDALPVLSSPVENNRYGIGIWVDQLDQHGPAVPALAAGGRGFYSWIEPSLGIVFTFATDTSSGSNIRELASRMHAEVLRVVPPLCETGMGTLTDVEFQPPAPGEPGRFSARYSGGYPLGRAHLQASLDLGGTEAWTPIATAALDGNGAAAFVRVPDARPHALRATTDFFRVVTEPASPDDSCVLVGLRACEDL